MKGTCDMSANGKPGIEHPQDLIDLYGENFTMTTPAMHELVEFIDQYGDVDAGVMEFVDDEFREDMLACHENGTDVTFDDYAEGVTFPYGEDAFREHLRAIWDDSISE